MKNKIKKWINKKRKKARKRTGRLRYLANIKPIDTQTANNSNLGEAYNKDAAMPEFALLSESGKQIGPWMRCKDYVQDCIWGGKFAKSYTCHGFLYTHGKDPVPNLKKLHLAMRFRSKNKQLPKMLENVKGTVEDLEGRLKIPQAERTKFSRVIKGKPGDYFVVYGSHHWLKATHTISFFTFLLRSSFLNVEKKIETTGKTAPTKKDTYYFNSGRKYMDMLSEVGIDGVENNWDTHKNHNDPYKVHRGGFVAWSYKHGATTADKTKVDDNWEF